MPKIDEITIDRILSAARIEEVATQLLGRYDRSNPGGLRKIGVRYTAICPFHDDHNSGNFIVYPKSNCYKCFTCGAAGDSVKLVMEYEKLSFPDAIRWLGKMYNIDVDDVPVDYKPVKREVPPPLPLVTFNKNYVLCKEGERLKHDALLAWIRTGIRWDAAARGRIDDVIHEYHVGHSTFSSRNQMHEFTLFWQIDNEGRVRTGHYMKYKPDGHRQKDNYAQDWFHSLLLRPRPKRDESGYPMIDKDGETIMEQPYLHIYDDEKQRVEQCLFGLHLMNKYPNATVNIVESEKTAVLMAIAYGNHQLQVWMACCGSHNLTRERLQPLISKNRKIVLYPDRDGCEEWKRKADDIHYARLAINAEPVLRWWREGDGEKADIADVVIRIINEAKPINTIKEVAEIHPNIKKLINNLNLDIEK